MMLAVSAAAAPWDLESETAALSPASALPPPPTSFPFSSACPDTLRALPLSVPLPILRKGYCDAATGDAVVCPPLPSPGTEERADMAEIVPGLFLGSWRAAADSELLRRCGVECVLNLCAHATADVDPFRWQGQEYVVQAWPQVSSRICLPAYDSMEFDISRHFAVAFRFLLKALEAELPVLETVGAAVLGCRDLQQRKGAALVHCRAGASRSATVVIAFLMWRHGLSLADAESLTLTRRPDACPNGSFWRQLRTLEAKLLEVRCGRAPLTSWSIVSSSGKETSHDTQQPA